MTAPIVIFSPVQPSLWPEALLAVAEPVKPGPACTTFTLHDYWLRQDELPPSITTSATIMRLLKLLGPLHWERLPERGLKLSYRFPPIPYAALIAAELIGLNESIPSLKRLRQFLNEHAGFISLLGFPGLVSSQNKAGFNTQLQLPTQRLPTQRHLARMLRMIPNGVLQTLLADSVDLIVQALSRPARKGPQRAGIKSPLFAA